MVNEIKEKVCYLGGHLLNQAMVEYREKQQIGRASCRERV